MVTINNNFQNQNINFKASSLNEKFARKATDFLTWGIKRIETGGILVDVCFVDMLGMVIPRTYQAFHRNEKELGHPNYKSGIEEFIREIFSGPSMFVIPMVYIVLSKHLFGTASKIQFHTLNALSDSFKRFSQNNHISTNKQQLKKDFYRHVFNEAFEKHRTVKLDNPVNIDEEIEKIIQNLFEIEENKKRSNHIKEIKRIVSDLNKSHGLNIDNSHTITLKNNFKKEIGDLIPDLINYSQDVVSKIAENLSKGTKKELISALIDKLHKIKTYGRRSVLIATFLSTVAFLCSVPIMYKRNKQFPGIDGLVKEKNQNRAKNSSSVESNMFNDFGQEVKALYVTDSPFQQNSQISFKGRIENVFKTLDFNGHNPPHLILGFYTLGIMLGARFYQARNRDERREVATRDFSGLSTIIFALPLFRNIVRLL